VDLLRQRKVKGGAFCRLALRPDPAAVQGDNPADRGQTDSRAGKIFRAVQTLKGAEKFPDLGHVKAYAIVPDAVDGLAGPKGHAKFNPGAIAPAGKLPGVFQQIGQCNPQRLGLTPSPLNEARFPGGGSCTIAGGTSLNRFFAPEFQRSPLS
jgi:hypothetical protein